MSLVLVATYECLSIYLSSVAAPSSSTGLADAIVEYRTSGGAWQTAHPAWFDRRPVNEGGNEYGGQEYRGSIPGLIAGISYEVRVTPSGGAPVTGSMATWSNTRPGTVVNVGAVNGTYRITQGGTPGNWRIYQGGVVNAPNAEYGVQIEASYVVLRNFTIKKARRHGVLIGPTHDYNNDDIHDVVIENNDISEWGSVVPGGEYKGFGRNLDSAVFSASRDLRRITVQRNTIHQPNFGSNSWEAPTHPRLHPRGPQGITFARNKAHDFALGLLSSKDDTPALRMRKGSNLTAVAAGTAPGNHVIRYNDIAGLPTKRLNDAIGGFGSNGTNSGAMIRDTDVYGNRIRYVWDDCIEGDGAYRNIRIWGNYFDKFFQGVSFQGRMGGPAYVWANIFGDSESEALNPTRGGSMCKGSIDGPGPATIDRLGGRLYAYNNLIMADGLFRLFHDGEMGARVRNLVALNNICNTQGAAFKAGNSSANPRDRNIVDYNRFSSDNAANVNSSGTTGIGGGYQSHKITSTPTYVAFRLPGAPGSADKIGDFRLSSSHTHTPLAGFPAGIGPAGIYEYGPAGFIGS